MPLRVIQTEQLSMDEVHIGHYILGRTIGTGGFAKVKEARHDLTGVRVAVKIINKRKMKNKNMISKVKREIKILKFINHQNIIKLYEVLDTTNDIFVIMELADGGELYDYIQNNDISEEQAKFFFRQIISGVEYAHLNLIAHRDLKPQNILMDSNKCIKIVDFGLSNLMKDGRLLKTACGSPNYAAPEIVGERKYEGTSVDIWSCGVILYALLIGSLPFDEETVTLLYRKIQQGNYTIPYNVNPLATDLIRRMLQVDPYKRIRIHEIKNHPWVRNTIQLYAKVPRCYSFEKEENSEIDDQVYANVRNMNFSTFSQANEQKIKKSIKKRDDESFVITYRLLKDQKERKQAGVLSISAPLPLSNMIVDEIKNIALPKKPQQQKQGYQYGKKFTKPVRILTEVIITSFRELGIDFTVKSKDYCIKCSFISSANRNGRYSKKTDSMIEEREEEESKQQKFTKKQIKFILQIYGSDSKGFQHMVDLQLSQGHPMVFFNIAHKLYRSIERLCLTY